MALLKNDRSKLYYILKIAVLPLRTPSTSLEPFIGGDYNI